MEKGLWREDEGEIGCGRTGRVGDGVIGEIGGRGGEGR